MPSFYLKTNSLLVAKKVNVMISIRSSGHSPLFRFWINEVTAGLENIAEEIANATEDQDKEVCFVIGRGGL